jgi:hypothetical protein
MAPFSLPLPLLFSVQRSTDGIYRGVYSYLTAHGLFQVHYDFTMYGDRGGDKMLELLGRLCEYPVAGCFEDALWSNDIQVGARTSQSWLESVGPTSEAQTADHGTLGQSIGPTRIIWANPVKLCCRRGR